MLRFMRILKIARNLRKSILASRTRYNKDGYSLDLGYLPHLDRLFSDFVSPKYFLGNCASRSWPGKTILLVTVVCREVGCQIAETLVSVPTKYWCFSQVDPRLAHPLQQGRLFPRSRVLATLQLIFFTKRFLGTCASRSWPGKMFSAPQVDPRLAHPLQQGRLLS